MSDRTEQRRLAAIILATDIVGYSRLMAGDEEATLGRLRSLRAELVDPAIKNFSGRIVKLMGDGSLVEFVSVVDAPASPPPPSRSPVPSMSSPISFLLGRSLKSSR